METHAIREVALARGVTPQALDAITAMVQAHFAGGAMKPAEVEAFIAGLPTWDKLGMPYAAFDKLHPNVRSGLDRTHSPKPPEQRRPVTRSLTQAELAALEAEGLTGAAYTEKARALQQTPAPERQA